MLIKRQHLEAIVRGEVDLAFRRWKRPTVRRGGRLRTAMGVLAIDALDEVAESSISAAEASRAGFESRAALIAGLGDPDRGRLYRIALHWAGEDPRPRLRESRDNSAAEAEHLRSQLARWDAASRKGPWTRIVLELIADRPATRVAELAAAAGFETKWFKTQVRKLKELGLTVSLERGYRLSPRGRRLLRLLGP